MLIWLLNWRQLVWVTLLVSVLWSGGLICNTQVAEERLALWWRTEEKRIGYGHLQVGESRRRVRESWRREQGVEWGAIGSWVGVSLMLSWQVWMGESNAMQILVLVIATHQVRNKVHYVREMRCWERGVAVWQDVVKQELRGTIAQARQETIEESVLQKEQSPGLEMGQSLAKLVENLPIGTNLGMLHFLWALVSGNFLESRGAIFPALQRMGLDEGESRRAWAAFAGGKWEISELLSQWQSQVRAEGVWEEHSFEGYRVKAVDLVGFWRPTLQNCPSKHYKAEAGKALPAVVTGMVTRVGQIGEQRIPLPTDFVRVDAEASSEASLTTKLLKQVAETLTKDELAVFDAGFNLGELLEVGVERFLLRLATNAIARRNYLPEYKGKGRLPEWGSVVRPLSRTYKGKDIAATPPDRQTEWQIEDKKKGSLTIKAFFWDNLVHSQQKPDTDAVTFNIVAIYDPRYKKPLLLATPLNLKGETLQALYVDRWPVEQLPLSAKQMIGTFRQFVHASESVQRLPEISLLAGAVLTYVAAKLPPIPTGFWDKSPKATPGRLRRVLTGLPLSPDLSLSARIRKKNSAIAHLLKGILAHRRQKRVL